MTSHCVYCLCAQSVEDETLKAQMAEREESLVAREKQVADKEQTLKKAVAMVKKLKFQLQQAKAQVSWTFWPCWIYFKEICLAFSLCVCISVSVPLSLSLCLFLSVPLSVCLFFCFSLCLCLCLSFPLAKKRTVEGLWCTVCMCLSKRRWLLLRTEHCQLWRGHYMNFSCLQIQV